MNKIVDIMRIVSEEECYAALREIRWEKGVRCPHCHSETITRNGNSHKNPHCQKYVCGMCQRNFDDLTSTIISGHHQPLSVWFLMLYLMGLNLSNSQIARELHIPDNVAHLMSSLIREEIERKTNNTTILSGIIEMDEAYVVAGHKGYPDVVSRLERHGRRRRLKGARGRSTLLREKPPIFGMQQRGGDVIIRMLADVKRTSIQPLIERFVERCSTVYTDEFEVYSNLWQLGFP